MSVRNILYFLLLVILCQILPIAKSLDGVGIKTFGDDKTGGFEVTWDKIDDKNDEDPILGYQVKIWRVKKVKKSVYKLLNGKYELTEEEDLPGINLNKDISDEVTVIDVPANETKAVYNGIILGETYEVGVLARTKTNNGTQSYSGKMRIKLNP